MAREGPKARAKGSKEIPQGPPHTRHRRCRARSGYPDLKTKSSPARKAHVTWATAMRLSSLPTSDTTTSATPMVSDVRSGRAIARTGPTRPAARYWIVVEEVATGVVTEVEGSAHLTGRHEFVLEPDDELGEGFLLR